MAKNKPQWVVGYIDEVWWSRIKIPKLKNWVEEKSYKIEKKSISKQDKESKAIACYGCLRIDNKKIYLRFTKQRPKSLSTIGFLKWLSKKFEIEGKKVLVLFWDNATWHCSHMVRKWIKKFNQKAKKKGSIRLIVHFLPVKSPWLNPIEPCWLHGKKAVFEPNYILSVKELRQRICAYYKFPLLPFLST